MIDTVDLPSELTLGVSENRRAPLADQLRQRRAATEILKRFQTQPGVILADEVGMGKTFVALAVAHAIGSRSRKGPVVVMAPPNLLEKWRADLNAFCSLYLPEVRTVERSNLKVGGKPDGTVFRYGVARHSIEFLKLLDDSPRERCHVILLAQGAMSRAQTDPWVRLALIREVFRRHGRRERLRLVKPQIHRFLGRLLHALGQQQGAIDGDEIWIRLLQEDPEDWKATFNAQARSEKRQLDDDPVPAAICRVLPRIDVELLSKAIAEMPVRARGGEERVNERIDQARTALRQGEGHLWKEILAKARWRSPLLILDEAHHLKNPRTSLARQFRGLQSRDSDEDLKLGDGALAGAFERMLFLTATPFQLGHQELIQVLRRFLDVRWDGEAFGDRETVCAELDELRTQLTASQHAAVRLQHAWTRLQPEDFGHEGSEAWWLEPTAADQQQLTLSQKTFVDRLRGAVLEKRKSESGLRKWIIRHNRPEIWPETSIRRRHHRDGHFHGEGDLRGLEIPSDQLLPFFLAARSEAAGAADLLGQALCSSYEAFRDTRLDSAASREDQLEEVDCAPPHGENWYLSQFDQAVERCSGGVHPKIYATVRKAADLWEAGEKVLIFAFYRKTCRALRIHISRELERRIEERAQARLGLSGGAQDQATIDRLIGTLQSRFFDHPEAPGRAALDTALRALTAPFVDQLTDAEDCPDEILDVLRRFLRTRTTLIRSFPLERHEETDPAEAVELLLSAQDSSGFSWTDKFTRFLEFLLHQCSSPEERRLYLDAAGRTKTGDIRLQADDPEPGDEESIRTLPNVQGATGETHRETRQRLMRSFNTPFFPDIFICSQVMGEGVDLHRDCRHIIHHDLDWNPSNLEQRTGRVDRIGSKAEQKQLPIPVYRPFLAGTSDERMYRVMTDREAWFRIVMGHDEVNRLIPMSHDGVTRAIPPELQAQLTFQLGLSE